MAGSTSSTDSTTQSSSGHFQVKGLIIALGVTCIFVFILLLAVFSPFYFSRKQEKREQDEEDQAYDASVESADSSTTTSDVTENVGAVGGWAPQDLNFMSAKELLLCQTPLTEEILSPLKSHPITK
jgi:hypothetical protein